MKKHKLSILGISMLLLVTSCKKSDVLQPDTTVKTTTAAITANTAGASQWQTVNNWITTKMENATMFSTTIKDSTITSAIAGNGLVLVFKKSGSTVNGLPFQESSSNNSWFYQVSANTITINCNSTSGQALGSNESFSYYIISSDKINQLTSQGHSKIELMELSYENAAALLK